jgi:hypothetical protein
MGNSGHHQAAAVACLKAFSRCASSPSLSCLQHPTDDREVFAGHQHRAVVHVQLRCLCMALAVHRRKHIDVIDATSDASGLHDGVMDHTAGDLMPVKWHAACGKSLLKSADSGV